MNGSRTQEAALISELYHEYRDELLGCATALMRSPDLAEEAVQQVFANTVVTLRKGIEIRHPRRWLHRCLRNHCLNDLREMKKLREESAVSIHEAVGVTDNETAPDIAELRERCAAVHEAVGSLSPTMREVFLLAEVRGLGYQEISDVIGKTVGSVRYQLHQARKQIRQAVRHESALIAGPLLWIGARGPEFATRPPTPRELLKAKLDSLSAWLGSLGERVSQPSAKPALALMVGAVVAGPIVGAFEYEPGAGPREEKATTQQSRSLSRLDKGLSGPAEPIRVRSAGDQSGLVGAVPRSDRVSENRRGASDRSRTNSTGQTKPAAGKSASTTARKKDRRNAKKVPADSKSSPKHTPFDPGDDDEPETDPGRESFENPGPDSGIGSFDDPGPKADSDSLDDNRVNRVTLPDEGVSVEEDPSRQSNDLDSQLVPFQRAALSAELSTNPADAADKSPR